MSKETFILRTEWYEAITELDPTDQATILRNLFAYHSGADITLDTFGVKIVWKLIEPTLQRNVESYDKRSETSARNGIKGGRPQEKPINNLNKPIETQAETQKPIKTISDSVIVSEYVSDSGSVSDADYPTPTEKIKDLPEYILTAPGTSPAHDTYYEQEICMRYSFTREQVQDIYTAWLGDRLNHLFTLKEARLNFASYCAKWKQNNTKHNRNGPLKNTVPVLKSSYV